MHDIHSLNLYTVLCVCVCAQLYMQSVWFTTNLNEDFLKYEANSEKLMQMTYTDQTNTFFLLAMVNTIIKLKINHLFLLKLVVHYRQK